MCDSSDKKYQESIKNDKFNKFETTWMNLREIILAETSRKEKEA